MSNQVPPLLVLAWGNPSRGDDALGPLLAERLLDHAQATGLANRVEVLTDFQLQVEHALDLVGRERILFVDAELNTAEAFTVRPLQPARGGGIGSHALAPEAVLQVYQDLHGHPPAPATLLAVRGLVFALGTTPSAQALADLDQAVAWACRWLQREPVTEETSA